ncbi:MAG: tRNA1(Val) (adenine(37)-N6)-methyltransferase [Clostridia bacterium]|nr:tRNA1(Val) (adenine(37)-N6)-methyltransferase [Clostridia bacterium]
MADMKETIENIGFGDLKLIQSSNGFRFGVDAVILADFAAGFCPAAGEVADLGTGNGVIPLILSHKNSGCHVTGFDVQPQAVDIARRSCELNHLEDRIDFTCCDVKDIAAKHPNLAGAMDAVVSNPPYVARGGGIVNDADSLMIARQETSADLEDFMVAAAKLLKERGHFFMVHRPSRLVDIFHFGRKHRLEPKDVRFVIPSPGKKANIVLIHFVLGGGHELNIMDELSVRDSEGNYSSEIMSIYEKTG